jgi:hypothetical protein
VFLRGVTLDLECGLQAMSKERLRFWVLVAGLVSVFGCDDESNLGRYYLLWGILMKSSS